MLQEYPHFNPQKYDLQVKVASVRTSAHSKHNINYHLVWIPKYRKKLLTGRVRQVLTDYPWCVCESKGNTVYFTCQHCQEKHVFDNANMTIDRFVEISKAFCTLHKNCKEVTI